MEYTIKELAVLAGVSTRTLRYYDEINLLKPARVNSSGYRIYGTKEVDKLQHILFYKELGVHLMTIKKIISSKSFDSLKSLKEHREKLFQKKRQLEILISNVEKTIAMEEGRIYMSDYEKFGGFKKELVNENERKYGKEVREKYGDETVNHSNQKFLNITKEEYDEFARLGEEILNTLDAAFETGDPAGELAQKAADLHKQWLYYTWGSYNKEAYAGLAQMYVDDERFTAYYDRKKPGTAAFLRDAILIYTGKK